MKQCLEQLLRGGSLSRAEAGDVLRALASGAIEPAVAGALLSLLRFRGETPEELAGFAQAMRDLASPPGLTGDLVDIVGTGGDSSASYNISTGAALLAAACGLRIAKHGNRAISSACGSADVLQALGIAVPLRGDALSRALERTGFTFLFAPDFHPAMAAIAPVRRALGVRTIFNMLGPLTNPARPVYGVIGAFSPAAARTIAGALSALEIRRYFVVHGAQGWDEPTPMGPFLLLDVRPGVVSECVRDPADLGLARCSAEDLRGGGPSENAQALEATLCGAQGPLADALALGAALALEVAGAAESGRSGIESARAAVRSGMARQVLEVLRNVTQTAAACEPVERSSHA